MSSTFFGLETARRGMVSQQGALYVTGQNIANANTPGYSRQRVNLVQTTPFPAPGWNRPEIPGQLGTGVEAGSIQRIRDSFLDVQYRGENNKLGYWKTLDENYKKLEEIMNEPSETGLANTIDKFWQSLQDLAANPKSDGARAVVSQRGMAVAETFSYLANSLNSIKSDLETEISVTKSQIDSIAEQIANVNKQIGDVEPHGYLPNDLYDERDRLIDELSSLININVEYEDSGGNASKMAEGQAVISLAGGPVLVSGDTAFTDMDLNQVSIGKLQALIHAHDDVYPQMIADLDNLAYTIATQFNKVQSDAGLPPFFDVPEPKAQVVFIVDNTSSMGDELENVTDNLEELAGKLTGDGIESTFGLVTFGQDGEPGGSPNKNPLTTDINDILSKLNTVLKEDEKNLAEPGLEAIMEAINYNLDSSDGVKEFVLITDAPVYVEDDEQSEYSISEVIDALAEHGIKLHVISKSDNGQLRPLANQTDGKFLNIDSETFDDDLYNSIKLDIRKGYADQMEIGQPDFESDPSDETSNNPSDELGDGNTTNILNLLDVFDGKFDYDLSGDVSDFRSYYQSVIGKMAVDSQQSGRLSGNSDMLRQAVEERRMEVSSVSLDEEMTNLIQFQHAYTAAARMITVQDQLLDKIINGMGTVGR